MECNEISNCGEERGEYQIKHDRGLEKEKLLGCSGEIHLENGLDNETAGVYTLEMWKDDEWHKLATENLTRGCSEISETLPELFSLLSQPANCPLSRGTYRIQQSYLSGNTLSKFPKLPFGRFRLVVKILRLPEEELRGCVHFDVNVIPAERLESTTALTSVYENV